MKREEVIDLLEKSQAYDLTQALSIFTPPYPGEMPLQVHFFKRLTGSFGGGMGETLFGSQMESVSPVSDSRSRNTGRLNSFSNPFSANSGHDFPNLFGARTNFHRSFIFKLGVLSSIVASYDLDFHLILGLKVS